MGFELIHELAVVGTACFVVALQLLTEQLGWFTAGHKANFSYRQTSYQLISYAVLFGAISVLGAYLNTELAIGSIILGFAIVAFTLVFSAANQAPMTRRLWLALRAAVLLGIGSVILFFWPW